MNRLSKLIILFIIFSLCLSLTSQYVFAANTYNECDSVKSISYQIDSKVAFVDGQEKTLQYAPFIRNDRAYLPLRQTIEELGGKVSYQDGKITIMLKTEVSKDFIQLEMRVGKTKVHVVVSDEYKYDFDIPVAPIIENDRVFIPASAFMSSSSYAEFLYIVWSEKLNRVLVSTVYHDIFIKYDVKLEDHFEGLDTTIKSRFKLVKKFSPDAQKLDGIYSDGNIEITLLSGMIWQIELVSDKLTTTRDIKIGDTKEKVETLYGGLTDAGSGIYTVSAIPYRIMEFEFKDNIVTKIRFHLLA